MKFTQSLVAGVFEKFKRPSVVAALLGYETNSQHASHLSAIFKGKTNLPLKWAGRFAELLNMDPQLAHAMVESERKAAGFGTGRFRSSTDDVAKALAAYPLASSQALDFLPPEQRQLPGITEQASADTQ